MMKLRFALIAYVFWMTGTLMAQPVIIRGEAPVFKQQLIEFLAITDWVTLKTYHIGETRISEEGTFACTLQVSPDTLPALYFSLAGATTQFQLTPGRTYTLKIPATDPSQVGLTAENDTLDRWFHLAKYESFYNDYVLANEKALRTADFKKVIQRFVTESEQQFGKHPDAYVQATATYRSASTLLALEVVSRAQLIKTYVQGKPVLYDHPDYMDFFLQLYPPMFQNWAQEVRDSSIRTILMQGANYDSLLQAVATKAEIPGREVAELVVVSGCYALYKEKLLKDAQISQFMTQAYVKVVHPSLRRIIRQILQRIHFLQRGTPFPDIRALRADGSQFVLSENQGKAVYLMFFEMSNPPSLAEFLASKAFVDRYKDELQLVGICMDCNFTLLDQLSQTYKIKAELVLSSPGIMDQFEMVRTFTAFLIDKEGNVAQAPAKSPGNGGDGQIYDLLRKVQRR
jgi:peroxiredoxin